MALVAAAPVVACSGRGGCGVVAVLAAAPRAAKLKNLTAL